MVGGIQNGGGMGRAAIDAALKQMRARASELQGGAAAAEALPSSSASSPGPSFANAVQDSIRDVDQENKAMDELHVRALKGELDFHEVTSQLKRAEMSFEFAMQVRNKFVEAYREVMRMNV